MTLSKILIVHIPPNGFWEWPIHLDTIVNDHVIPKNNSNWSIQIIGPLIGKNNVWKHRGQKENINCQQCYGGGHKKWKQNAYNIDQ